MTLKVTDSQYGRLS